MPPTYLRHATHADHIQYHLLNRLNPTSSAPSTSGRSKYEHKHKLQHQNKIQSDDCLNKPASENKLSESHSCTILVETSFPRDTHVIRIDMHSGFASSGFCKCSCSYSYSCSSSPKLNATSPKLETGMRLGNDRSLTSTGATMTEDSIGHAPSVLLPQSDGGIIHDRIPSSHPALEAQSFWGKPCTMDSVALVMLGFCIAVFVLELREWNRAFAATKSKFGRSGKTEANLVKIRDGDENVDKESMVLL